MIIFDFFENKGGSGYTTLFWDLAMQDLSRIRPRFLQNKSLNLINIYYNRHNLN